MSEISVTVVGSTSINPTVGNGDTVNVSIASTGERGPSGSSGAAGPANTLTIGTVSQGTAAATITGTSPNQVLNLVLPKGDSATPATNIELQATGTHIQWRLVGASTWTNLVALSAITGPTGSTGAAGAAVELQASGTHIQWRYVGGSTWTNVVALSSLVGATGATGATGPQGPAGSVNLADETPQPLGTASAGTALSAARADHVHAQGSIAYSGLSGIPSTFAPSAHQHVVADVTGLQAALDGKQVAGSYATLVGGTVPSSQLPSYVDDVIEYSALSGFPSTNDGGKIFVARDTGKIYRWSGSAYIEISPSPGSTDSVVEGSTNLYHTTARAAAAAPVQSVAGRTGTVTLAKGDVGLGNVTNVDATARANHSGTQTAATISDFAAEAAKYGPVTSVNGQTGAVTVSGGGNYTLPTATDSVLGGVKVGSGLTISSGVLSTIGGGGLSWSSVPASPTATASAGAIAYDSSYFYTAVSANTWRRLAWGDWATDPNFGSVALLLHMNGTDRNFVDFSGAQKTIAAYGNATQSATESKFGGLSAYFDGAGDYIETSTYNQSSLQFGAQQHTVEFWFKTASTQQYTCLFYKGRPQSSAYDYVVNINNSSASSGDIYIFSLGFGGVAIGTSTGGWNDDAWHHLAIVRDAGNVWRIYVDGVQRVSATNAMTESYSTQSDSIIRIGKDGALSGRDYAGYIDDLRITTLCRYPSGTTFARPAAPFPDVGPMSAPTSLTATGGNAQISLTWTAPSYNGGSAITGYSVEYTPSGASPQTVSTGSTSTSYTLTGLTNGTAYTVRVAGINANGTGTYTAASSSVTPAVGTPPNAPTSLTATAGNAQIALSWTAPSAPGTSAISGYTVEYTPSGGSAQTVSTGSTATSYTLTGLTNGTSYTVRVAAVSAAGTGTYTAASSSVTPASASVPGAPTSLTSGGASSCGLMFLSWTAPSDGGSAITSYRIRYNENSYANFVSFSPSGGTANRQINLSLLIADGYRTVTIRLSAVNAIGEGPYVTATINPANDMYGNCG